MSSITRSQFKRIRPSFYQCIRTFSSAQNTRIIQRFYQTDSSSFDIRSKNVLIITGGTAKVTTEIAAEADKRGYKVYFIARKIPPEKVSDSRFIKIDEKDLTNPNAWSELLTNTSKDADSLSVINTIGTAIVPKGQTLVDVNERPILAVLEALKTINIRKRIGQISSIAATYLPDDQNLLSNFDPKAIEYCLGRRQVDLKIASCGIPATILRPGFVFNSVSKTGRIGSGHDYSPEQFTHLLVHPLIGSGKQLHQPVHVGDMITGLFNGIETDKTLIVNAVGPEPMSQEEMIKFYLYLANKPFRPIKIPYDVASIIAKHVPKGRLAPYSVSLLQHLEDPNLAILSGKPFEQLVGRPLTTFKEAHSNTSKVQLSFPTSPLNEHMKEIIYHISINPEARRDFLIILSKYGSTLVFNAIKSYINN